ncbi:TRAF-like family protein [Euphorbia peplus]|nr:TRAF-like family protein [Euphorbia peplus]
MQGTGDVDIKRAEKRDAPAVHFIWKIKSFSQLSEIAKKTGQGKYMSDEFEAGEYKWKLVLHPNGKTNGEGHISLYLESTDKNAILGNSGGHINVLISFYVYDSIRDNYLTIGDGKIKRYRVLKAEHGFDQLLPLAKFNDPKNGYLLDDCCVFGVEVHVIKNSVKGKELSFVKDPPNGTFTWKVDKFSALENPCYFSEVFSVGGCKWKLKLYPKRDSQPKSCNVSLYLCLDENPHQNKVYAEYSLSVRNQVNGKLQERKANDWFEKTLNSGWGCENTLINSGCGFLVNDTLVFEAKFTLISVSQDLIC